MLWIQYEATEQIQVTKVQKIVEGIAKYIEPYPVAAFDRGKFGVGLVVSAISTRVSDYGSNDDHAELEIAQRRSSSSGSCQVSWDSGSDRPPLSSTPSSKSVELSGEDRGTAAENSISSTPSNDAGLDEATANGSTSDFSGSGVSSVSHTGGSGRPEAKRAADDDENNDADSYHPNEDEATQPPVRKRNDRFSGTVTLQLSDTLKQELTISMGLQIRPILGEDFTDCKITLNPVQVMASSLYCEDEDDDLDSATSHYYVSEKVRILIRACEGYCEPPDSLHPLVHHFQEQVATSVGSSYGACLEISTNPKLVLKGSKDKGKMVDQPGVTIGLEVGHIGSAAGGKGFQWNYRPHGPYATNLELSSSNWPSHQARYRVYQSDTPNYFKVLIRATFRQNAKLTRSHSPHAPALRILRDLRAMHVTVTLEVKIGRDGEDWFLFPAEGKGGRRLNKTIKLENGWLEGQLPTTVDENWVRAQLEVS